jgi:hypothetical protein
MINYKDISETLAISILVRELELNSNLDEYIKTNNKIPFIHLKEGFLS